jgi:hypothetical protein
MGCCVSKLRRKQLIGMTVRDARAGFPHLTINVVRSGDLISTVEECNRRDVLVNANGVITWVY